MHSSQTDAVCRGCGRVLRGKPYHIGGAAYHPETGERCPSNFYGGFVCSEGCDRRASLEQENSFPGAGRSNTLSPFAQQSLNNHWRNSR